jgi:hypothetical protein
MSQPDFYAILDECVTRLGQGELLEACLADYPEQAAELNPALAVSADLLYLPRLDPAPEMMAQGYEAMMEAFTVEERPSWLAAVTLLPGKLLSPLKPQGAGRLTFALRAAMLLLLVLLASSAFVITVSADSLPGDTLYPVKRSWENTRLALTLAEPSRQALESKFAEQRREEVQAVLILRRPVIVEFQGRLQSTGAEVWLVDGLNVEVRDETAVSGMIVVGQSIFVRAQAQMDGTLLALEIVGDEGGLPGPAEPTRTPRPTHTSQPTRKLEPTAEVTPTREPTRRPTHEATATREPTRDLRPTATREPEPTDVPPDDIKPTPDAIKPTEEHRPTDEPRVKPTETPKPKDEPTRDHGPTATREPTVTRKPAPEPTVTHEPEPTAPKEPTPTSTEQSDAGDGSDRPA